jgi:hypothetical protein
MIVDEPGDDRSTLKLDDRRCRPGKSEDVLIAANRKDLVAGYRDGFYDRKISIDSQDLTVEKYLLRLWFLSRRGRQTQHARHGEHDEQS